jgi:hypothetical protein
MPARSSLAVRALLLAVLAAAVAHRSLAEETVVAAAAAAASDPVGESRLDVSAISAVYNCSAPASDTLIDYKYLAYCTPTLQDSPVAARVVLLALLGVMLYLLSSTADSFFCPVLQVSASRAWTPCAWRTQNDGMMRP